MKQNNLTQQFTHPVSAVFGKRKKKRSKKAGLPPGTLVYVGDREKETVGIELISYDGDDFHQGKLDAEECASHVLSKGVSWFNIDGIHDVGMLQKIGDEFHLHPLTLEDIVNAEQRPKFEEYDDYLFIVLKMIRYDERTKQILPEQVSLILRNNVLLSFQEGIEGDVFESIRERLRNGRGKIRTLGADYVCYTLIDSVVDNYFSILESIGEDIEDLEEELLENPTPKTLHKIHHLKRELIFLRKSVWPLREVIGALQRDDSPFLSQTTNIFLRDVYDHTIQVIDTLETYRDMLSGMIDIYMSSISNKLNEVMKVLTIIATVFIPLTFIVGVYGMNFECMPELKWPFGYALVWGVMLLLAGGMFVYFRRKRWL